MGKHRVYIDALLNTQDTITIHEEDAWHMAGVLRLNIGDKVALCDGAEHECEAQIIQISKNKVILRPGTIQNTQTEPSIHVTLYQSLPKADKMELIIQKCVELGVTNIVPVHTSRSIPIKPDSGKIDRWQKIAKEAARQCGRGIIPAVAKPIELKNMTQKHNLLLIAYEEENKQSLSAVIKSNSNAKDIGIFIGPEGGISPEEVNALQSFGGICVSLGKRILRTETAGFAMLSAIMYAYGELG